MGRVIAVAHLPHLPLALRARVDASGRERTAVAVVDEEAPDRAFLPRSLTRIVDADPPLWERRVLPGQRLVDAQRIAPALAIVVVKRRRINEALLVLAELLLQHSPIVEPLPSFTSGPSIALDLTGLLVPPAESLRDIERSLRAAGHDAVVVASPNKRLSLALAIDAARTPGRYRRSTRFVVDAHNVGRARERIGIASLGIDLPTLETFVDLGVKTAGDLRRLIPGGAAARLVDDARTVLRLFDGATEEPLSPLRPPEHIVEAVDLDDAVSLLEALRFVLSPLCERAVKRAILRGQKVAGVVVECAGRDLPTHPSFPQKSGFSIALEFPEPLHEARALLAALATRLEQTGVPGPVEQVTLRVTRLSDGRRRQQDAFRVDDAAPAALGALLAELAIELGPDCAGCLRVTRALLPEEMSTMSWPVSPPQGPHRPLQVGVDLDDVARDGRFLAGWPWPVRLLREPVLLADVDAEKRMSFARLEGEDGSAVPFLRDYQVLVLKDGRWMFTWRDPETGDEHLQGFFD